MFSKNKKIFISNDHAGFKLSLFLIQNNPQKNWEHLGIFNELKSHYPTQATLLCQNILNHKQPSDCLGVLICGSGQGMAIKANRFCGIRAALAWNQESCSLARKHNNVNVLCLGSRLLDFQDANNIFQLFINTPFEGGHHLKRVESLDQNEQ